LIEADISRYIEDVLLGLGGIECEVFVSDGEGRLWVSADPKNGVQLASPGKVIKDLPTDLIKQLSEQGKSFELEKDLDYIVKRFFVDPAGRGVVIFARLPKHD
jgi:hypothetical protein